ncbi:hypothetical protein VSDG_10080 [Cytospora chrysosperma]|uniref:Uncharacterized protein n=1 Tax=Cytospora chrysosperma TaxID=252740 RepID=A0A423V813_CYTCH|nr:hypothetical protein VSDG_10080 [Valsa sordida]
MARDNGFCRGYHRHSDATKPTAPRQQQASTSEEANKLSADLDDADAKATEMTMEMDLTIFRDHQYINGPSTDHLSDQASDLLNARFPPMSVPGSMPRRQTNFFRSLGRQRPAYGWTDVGIATAFYGSAVFGFCVIMRDGLEAVGGLLEEAGRGLVYEVLLRLGF